MPCSRTYARWAAAGLLALGAAGLSACGSDDSGSAKGGSDAAAKPTTLAIAVSGAGKEARYSAPATVRGGLVDVRLANRSKAPHGAQLLRIIGDHTAAEALKVIGSHSERRPRSSRR